MLLRDFISNVKDVQYLIFFLRWRYYLIDCVWIWGVPHLKIHLIFGLLWVYLGHSHYWVSANILHCIPSKFIIPFSFFLTVFCLTAYIFTFILSIDIFFPITISLHPNHNICTSLSMCPTLKHYELYGNGPQKDLSLNNFKISH